MSFGNYLFFLSDRNNNQSWSEKSCCGKIIDVIFVSVLMMGLTVLIFIISGMIGDQINGTHQCVPFDQMVPDCILNGFMNLAMFLIEIIMFTVSTGPYFYFLLVYLGVFQLSQDSSVKEKTLSWKESVPVKVIIAVILAVWAIFQVQLLGIVSNKIIYVVIIIFIGLIWCLIQFYNCCQHQNEDGVNQKLVADLSVN
jgi:hypothetical protein